MKNTAVQCSALQFSERKKSQFSECTIYYSTEYGRLLQYVVEE